MNQPANNLDDRGLPPGYTLRDDWEITPRQVKAMRDAGEVFLLLDCRTPAEQEAASVEGATLIPLHELPTRVGELAPHADRTIVTMCHHGMRSLQAAFLLRQTGLEDVKSMAGGIDLWSVDIDADVPRY